MTSSERVDFQNCVLRSTTRRRRCSPVWWRPCCGLLIGITAPSCSASCRRHQRPRLQHRGRASTSLPHTWLMFLLFTLVKRSLRELGGGKKPNTLAQYLTVLKAKTDLNLIRLILISASPPPGTWLERLVLVGQVLVCLPPWTDQSARQRLFTRVIYFTHSCLCSSAHFL